MSKKKSCTKPIFRWAGSKRKILPTLSPYWKESYARYVEPFAGSACLFFALEPKRALIADNNAELISTYRTLKNRAKKVYDFLMKIPRGKRSYLKQRKLDGEKLSAIERAARFLFLNRFCFNGLYRTNLKGKFNVPYAPTGTGEISDWKTFRKSIRLLKKAEFICADFEETLKEVKENDFVYLDPPYAVEKRRVFKEYGSESFGTVDLPRFRESLQEIDRKKAKFVLSYAYCPEAKKMFDLWPGKKIRTPRNIAGFSKHRRYAYELLVTNIPSEIK